MTVQALQDLGLNANMNVDPPKFNVDICASPPVFAVLTTRRRRGPLCSAVAGAVRRGRLLRSLPRVWVPQLRRRRRIALRISASFSSGGPCGASTNLSSVAAGGIFSFSQPLASSSDSRSSFSASLSMLSLDVLASRFVVSCSGVSSWILKGDVLPRFMNAMVPATATANVNGGV